jgi:hypothetical protein
MDRASFTIRMAGSMMDNGSAIKWMVMGFCIINLENLLTKDFGKVINFKEKENCTMKLQSNFRKNMITLALIKSTNIGLIIKVYF